MTEDLSPELKLYVKEEIEKAKKEIKEELEKVKSKATRTFTTVAIVVGLLTGLGVYGLATNYINTAIKEGLGENTLTEIDKNRRQAKEWCESIDNTKTQAEEFLSNLKSSVQLAETNGYTRFGDIKLIWGTRYSTSDNNEIFEFGRDSFPQECFAVITELPGDVVKVTEKNFTFNRMNDYDSNVPFYFVAIGH